MPAQAYLVSALGRVVREFGVSVLVVRIQTLLPMRLASTAKVGAAIPMVCKAGVVRASRGWRASATRQMTSARACTVKAAGRTAREFGVLPGAHRTKAHPPGPELVFTGTALPVLSGKVLTPSGSARKGGDSQA